MPSEAIVTFSLSSGTIASEGIVPLLILTTFYSYRLLVENESHEKLRVLPRLAETTLEMTRIDGLGHGTVSLSAK